MFCLALHYFTGCGSVSTNISTNDDDSENESATVPTSVALEGATELNFDENGTAVVNLETVDPSQNYLLTFYSATTDVSMSFNYEVTGSSSVSSASLVKQMLAADANNDEEDAHEMLRNMEDQLNPSLAVLPSRALMKAVTAGSVGSSRDFRVISSLSTTSQYSTVTATLRYATHDFYVYVDDRNASSLSDDELASILDPFSNIVDDERSLFGNESDVDGDDHFVILMTQEVNELGTLGGGMLTGFFYAVDLYDASYYAASNEMEILYTMVPDPNGQYGVAVSKAFSLSNILPSVFPHELQHMISYNQHVFVAGGSSEESFLNEGLSHLAEDIYSLNSLGIMMETGIENPARVAYYLDAPESICFVCGSSLSQRGGSYLFLRYLYEQAQKGNLSGASSGAGLINKLLTTTRVGVANIVYGALGTETTSYFKTLLSQFGMAVYLDDTATTTDSRYGFDGINLRSIQEDNRNTMLDGPAVTSIASMPTSGQMTSSGMIYFTLTGQQLLDAASVLQVSVSQDMQPGGCVMGVGE